MATFDVRTMRVTNGAQLSELVAIAGGDLFGIWAPTVTSCTLTIRGSFDQTSANFVPLSNPAGSGDWIFAVGPGSKGITLQDVAFPFPFAKLFTSVVQGADRDFVLISKRR